jgi:hypothetical protein
MDGTDTAALRATQKHDIGPAGTPGEGLPHARSEPARASYGMAADTDQRQEPPVTRMQKIAALSRLARNLDRMAGDVVSLREELTLAREIGKTT